MKEQIKKITLYGILVLSTLKLGGCFIYNPDAPWNLKGNHRRQMLQQEKAQNKQNNQDNHRHYPSVNEKMEEKVRTYFLFKGLEGLEKEFKR